ncbi:MAG TPA: putative peptidoglycan glycosyltransferase FtsW [Chlamydiales bacterium]|nr:putative peptidoglycan glycosyltransferase FtsW [Chlamydiales bacterium]
MSRSSFLLVICVLLLYALGLLMIFNTTAASALDRSLTSATHQAFFKQLIDGGIALIFGLVVYWYGFERLLQNSFIFLIGATLFLVLVFVPKIGMEINGAKRWIQFFGVSFQPSEFAKYLIPICFLKSCLSKKGMSFKDLVFSLLPLAPPLILILIEPDNGTTFIIGIAFIMLFNLCRIKWNYWVIPVLCVLIVGATVAYRMPHVPDRFRVYMHPELDLLGKGHQPHQAKIAAGSGKIWGRGLGESLQKLNYLPEARSDYIAAIYAEEFGFMGMLGMIILYMLIAYNGFRIAFSTPDKRGFYLASLLTFLLSFQAFLNLGVVSTLLPSKGTTLPFFSLGGTSLIANAAALFLLINIEVKTLESRSYEPIRKV